jgi:ribosomal protein S14
MSVGEVDECYKAYRETRRVARKAHECSACGRPIAPGDLYYDIAAILDGVRAYNRCPPCQAIHEHLRDALPNGEWPAEQLDCGHEYEELHGKPAPAWLQALAFWLPGDPLPCLDLCDALLAHDVTGRLRLNCYANGYPQRPWPNEGWGRESKQMGVCMEPRYDRAFRRYDTRPLPGMQLCEQVAS